MTVIRTKTGLKNYLENFINETIKTNLHQKALKEEEKQLNLSSEEKKEITSGEISVDSVIDKLNFIRSGRSFKDEKVKTGLSKYLEELKPPEKTALLTFLKGISQIVTAEIPAEDIPEPEDPPASISMERGGGKKVTIKPVVIKAGGAASKEDASGPTPIQVKK